MGRPKRQIPAVESESDTGLGTVPVETGQGGAADPVVTPPWDGQENIFWETEPGANYKVLIRRTKPETWPHPLNGLPVGVRGPLGELPPNATAEWVFANHGGGDFIVSAYTDSYITKTRRLHIPGAPLVRDPNTQGGPAGQPGIAPAPASMARTVTVDGIDVPISGSMEQTKQDLLQIMAWKAALRESTPDHELTSVLLRAVLDQKANNTPMGQLQETLGVFNQVKEMMPNETAAAGGSDPWWLPLAGRFLEVLPHLNKGKPAVTVPKPQLPAPAGQPAPPSIDAPNPTMEDPGTMPQQLDWQAVLTEAMGHIISHFQSEPATPENRVADLLDLVAPIPVDKRVQLVPLKQRLQDYGHSALAEPFADDPAKLAAWPGYFSAVFDLFTDPNRSPEGFPSA